MRGLFNVHIVDPEESEVIATAHLVIAKSAEDAKLKALADALKSTGAKNLTKDLDDYDIIVVRLGDVRAKRAVQEVRVVKDE